MAENFSFLREKKLQKWVPSDLFVVGISCIRILLFDTSDHEASSCQVLASGSGFRHLGENKTHNTTYQFINKQLYYKKHHMPVSSKVPESV